MQKHEYSVSRRECLTCWMAAGLGTWLGVGRLPTALAAEKGVNLHEALYYEKFAGGQTRCALCPNRCARDPGEDGHCHARGNRHGTYYSLVYGRPCVIALDEVEKCPLNHFQIHGKALSLATAGCNLQCQYCQNWNFSQAGPGDVPKAYDLSPDGAVAKALENKAAAIAFFYTEPTVYYEYMLDIAKLARSRGLKTIMVTAGYINPEPLGQILPHLDAVTLGLKGWNADYYRNYVGGDLEHVKESVRILAASKTIWWEVVNLVVPSLNDSMADIGNMAAWLRDTAGPERPLHFTRFRPEYRLKRLPMTPAGTLTQARETAMRQGLKYVYVGNLPGHEGANTYCPSCRNMVVERLAFSVLNTKLNKGACGYCGQKIGGVWT